jgi:hypothetical protein
MDVDLSRWSGEGAFTHTLVDALQRFEEIQLIRVEDAPSSRAESGYNFISNEVYVGFGLRTRTGTNRRLGVIPVRRADAERATTLATVEAGLSSIDGVGPPDYADGGMLQYLRTERVIPPYQRRGYKRIELVRIYEVGKGPGPDAGPVAG